MSSTRARDLEADEPARRHRAGRGPERPEQVNDDVAPAGEVHRQRPQRVDGHDREVRSCLSGGIEVEVGRTTQCRAEGRQHLGERRAVGVDDGEVHGDCGDVAGDAVVEREVDDLVGGDTTGENRRSHCGLRPGVEYPNRGRERVERRRVRGDGRRRFGEPQLAGTELVVGSDRAAIDHQVAQQVADRRRIARQAGLQQQGCGAGDDGCGGAGARERRTERVAGEPRRCREVRRDPSVVRGPLRAVRADAVASRRIDGTDGQDPWQGRVGDRGRRRVGGLGVGGEAVAVVEDLDHVAGDVAAAPPDLEVES